MHRHRLFFLTILFVVFFPLSSHAVTAEQNIRLTNPQLYQMIQSGKVTPDQLEKGMQLFGESQLNADTLQKMQKKAEQGELSREEIDAGRSMFEQQKAEDSPELFVEEKEAKKSKETKKSSEDEEKQQTELDKSEISPTGLPSFFMRVFGSELNGLHLFGNEIFSITPQLADPIKNIPVPFDYIVGPGDVIKVLMWGRMDASYSLEVDNEGVVNFPKIGSLTVAGLSYEEVKELFIQKAEAITGVNISVSMGRLRTIQIFVLGEVSKPGVHTVSSMATAINALLAAGGPTLQGSLRKVQIKRSGKILSEIDLYDFLMQGDISKDVRLMASDIVFVPPADTLVAITGNVNKPAVYELHAGGTTLQEALSLAGGLVPRAYNLRIQIQRASENLAETVLDIPLPELQAHEEVVLQTGDIVDIFPLLPGVVNAVHLYGNVARPGQYAFENHLFLHDLIPSLSALKTDTYFDYALIKRYRFEDMSTELIPFDLGALLEDPTGKENISLMPLDEVHIFNKWEFGERPVATIIGEVREPGIYEIEEMTIQDLIFKAGGLSKDAYADIGHLYRTDQNTLDVTIHSFDVGKAISGDEEENIQLMERDRLVIHNISEYMGRYSVSAQGEINNPGSYPYAGNMTVRDLILVAGNIKKSAYLENGEIIRFEIVDGKSVKTSLLNFNVSQALDSDPKHNHKLQPWDMINVKQIPEWGKGKVVTITGEVAFPGKYSIRKDERLASLIDRAGGYTENAYFRGAVFTRESVRILQKKRLEDLIDRLSIEVSQVSARELAGALSTEDVKGEQAVSNAQQNLINRLRNVETIGRIVIRLAPGPAFGESSYNLVLEDNDVLNIPAKPDTVSVSGEVYNPTSLIYNSKEPELKHYLAKTGGPTKYANTRQMFILLADGTVLSRNHNGLSNPFVSGFESTELYPGDTLVVPPKLLHPSFKRDLKDITAIIYQIAVSAGIIINQVFP